MRYCTGLSIAFACLVPLAAAWAAETPPPPATVPVAPTTPAVPAPPAPVDSTTKPATDGQTTTGAAAPASGTATPDPKDEEVVCKKIEKATGSRIGTKRVCMTRREWRDYVEE